MRAGRAADGGRGGLEIYGDSAYGSGQARAAYRDAGHVALIKPKPLFPAVPGGFTVDDFDIDEGNQQVTCPAAALNLRTLVIISAGGLRSGY